MVWVALTLFLVLCVLSFSAASLEVEELNSSTACGPNQPLVTTKEYGYLISPVLDTTAPTGLRCSWTLIAPPKKIVTLLLRFQDVNLYCGEDTFQAFDGNGTFLLHTFCDVGSTSKLTSKSNSMHLTFQSNSTFNAKDFRIYFEHVDPIVKCKKHEVRCRNERKCVHRHLKCDGVDNCGDGTDEEDCGNGETKPAKRCGVPSVPHEDERIVGGSGSAHGSWPWQVFLGLRHEYPLGQRCGGSLINNHWVLTAAHCFEKKPLESRWIVVAGKFRKEIREDAEQRRYVKSIYVHPNFCGFEEYSNMAHDIALLRLNAPVKITMYVLPVCLPTSGYKVPVSANCFVTGWGKTYGTGHDSVLKKAMVPIVDRNKCREWYKYRIPIHHKMICAGYHSGGHDSCSGDSGGPLVYKKCGRWIQVGVVSTGASICADRQKPGVYTEVAQYVKWIYSVLRRY